MCTMRHLIEFWQDVLCDSCIANAAVANHVTHASCIIDNTVAIFIGVSYPQSTRPHFLCNYATMQLCREWKWCVWRWAPHLRSSTAQMPLLRYRSVSALARLELAGMKQISCLSTLYNCCITPWHRLYGICIVIYRVLL